MDEVAVKRRVEDGARDIAKRSEALSICDLVKCLLTDKTRVLVRKELLEQELVTEMSFVKENRCE
jgi:hypothetical protein